MFILYEFTDGYKALTRPLTGAELLSAEEEHGAVVKISTPEPGKLPSDFFRDAPQGDAKSGIPEKPAPVVVGKEEAKAEERPANQGANDDMTATLRRIWTMRLQKAALKEQDARLGGKVKQYLIERGKTEMEFPPFAVRISSAGRLYLSVASVLPDIPIPGQEVFKDV